jgi:AraC-like DNA-binding protein
LTSSNGGVLDLRAVAAAQRAGLWRRSVRHFFPGLSVRVMDDPLDLGSISGLPFGLGTLWSVLSPPLRLDYAPAQAGSPLLTQHFSVLLQLEGSTLAEQRHQQCCLQQGDFCLIDGNASFQMQVCAPASRIMFIQMPRAAVLRRHPHLERHTACIFDASESGSALLRGLLLSVLDTAHLLESPQRSAVLEAVIQLLGAPKQGCDAADEVPWRVRAALSCIEHDLADQTLTATRVAQSQGISRRRLDELMQQWLGRPLTAQIWECRLLQAATDLVDPQRARQSVSQIAFAAGFEDPAHFSRAFKRRFGCTPRQWRVDAPGTAPCLPGALSA